VNITKKLGAQWPEDQKFVTLDPNHLYDKRNGEPHIMPTDPNTPAVPNRRRFLERVGTTLAAGTLATSSNVLAESSSNRPDIGPALNGPAAERLVEAFNLRVAQATRDALLGIAKNVSNGDETLYPDKGGTYTKGLPHDSFGRVDLNAYQTLKTALTSGKFADFQKITMGGTKTLNGPQGGLAFDLEIPDSVQFGQPIVPPAPPIAGDQTATELLEHYWASLLRDVAFTDYGSNSMAAMAAAELSALPTYLGPRDSHGQVTTNLLFRGGFPGEALGPYVSQFLITPTSFGAQSLSQQMVSYLPTIDYMTTFSDWLTVQMAMVPASRITSILCCATCETAATVAAFTHVDVLYQAYFVAFLVLAGIGAPPNPGNPYIGSKCENGFGTFGAPDFAATLGAIATKALNAVWYQKWFVHLRPRPEATGGQVHLVKTGQGANTNVQPSKVILNSVGLQQSFKRYGTWLLSQAFPEGSPTHPSYPTATAGLVAHASRF